jgi:hypothetical protein
LGSNPHVGEAASRWFRSIEPAACRAGVIGVVMVCWSRSEPGPEWQ